MAEEAKKKADAPAASAKPSDKGGEKKEAPKVGAAGLLTKTPVLLGGVMIIEAAVLFAGFKFLGGAPKQAAGAELVAPASGSEGEAGEGGAAAPAKIDKKKQVEIQIVDFRAP